MRGPNVKAAAQELRATGSAGPETEAGSPPYRAGERTGAKRGMGVS